MCDDTDVFADYFSYTSTIVNAENNAAPVIMASPLKDRAVVDIRATAEAQ